MTIQDFVRDFNAIKDESSNIYIRKDEDKVSFHQELMMEDSNIVALINCEYYDDEANYHIHYDMKYWGSKEFNNLLDKHNLSGDWYSECWYCIYSKGE